MTTDTPSNNAPTEQGGALSHDHAHIMADLLLQKHYGGGQYLLLAENCCFYHFEKTHWRKLKDVHLKKQLFNIAEQYYKEHPDISGKKPLAGLIKQAIELLEAKQADIASNLNPASNPRPVINVKNGEIWIDDEGDFDLRPHNPKSYQTYCIPYSYDKTTKCPTFNKAVLTIFSESKCPKAMRRHFKEVMGYLLQKRRHIPLILILRGGGENGKTVLTKTLQMLMGEDAVYSCVDITQMGKNKFAIGDLYGKLLLIDDDVRQGTKLPDGFLKKISEEKRMTGEVKHKASFQFICLAVPMLLCNDAPSVPDISQGMRRRIIVIPFDHDFSKDKDDKVFKKIWAEEMSGVLNEALNGMRRLLKRGEFKKPSAVIRATELLLEDGNPLVTFIKEVCEKNKKGKVLLDKFFEHYTSWAKQAGVTFVLQRNTLKRKLEHLKYNIVHTNEGNAVLGLKLAYDLDEFMDGMEGFKIHPLSRRSSKKHQNY